MQSKDGRDAARETPHGTRDRIVRRPVEATLAAGLVLLIAALVAAFSHAAVHRTGDNHLTSDHVLGAVGAGGRVCQRELVPHGTGAVRAFVDLHGRTGPSLRVVVLRGRATVAQGARAAGWSGGFVTVPVRPVVRDDVRARVCLLPGAGVAIGLSGETSAADVAAQSGGAPLPGRIRLAYLRPHAESWWAFAPTIAYRLGLGHALHGVAVAILVVVLVLASAALGVWQLASADA